MGSTQKKQPPSQRQRFIEKAREIGCEGDEAAFDAVLSKVGGAQAPKRPEKPKVKERAEAAKKERQGS